MTLVVLTDELSGKRQGLCVINIRQKLRQTNLRHICVLHEVPRRALLQRLSLRLLRLVELLGVALVRVVRFELVVAPFALYEVTTKGLGEVNLVYVPVEVGLYGEVGVAVGTHEGVLVAWVAL